MSKEVPTHADAELLLKLYDLRREARLRQARDWFFNKFAPKSLEDMMQQAPPGSDENAFMRMVTSYWETACALLNHGLIHEDLFFETTGEQYMIWVRLEPFLPEIRQQYGKSAFQHLERAAKRYEAWMEQRDPGRIQKFRAMLASRTAQTARQ